MSCFLQRRETKRDRRCDTAARANEPQANSPLRHGRGRSGRGQGGESTNQSCHASKAERRATVAHGCRISSTAGMRRYLDANRPESIIVPCAAAVRQAVRHGMILATNSTDTLPESDRCAAT